MTNVRKRSLSVLVVDDNASMRAALRGIVKGDGHDVIGEAAEGKTALTLIRQMKPDVVLLDMMMPVMDGLRFLAWLGEHPDISDRLRVVVLSAYALDNETDRDLHNLKKVSAIINKPVVVTRLLETLHQTLQTDA